MKKQCVTSLPLLQSRGGFSGYASVFWQMDSDGDVIVSGAFQTSIAQLQRPVALLWQHEPKQPIGQIIQLQEDAYSLHIHAELNLHLQQAREAYALLQAGDMTGLSIGFLLQHYDLDAQSGVRFITQAELWEVSLVTFPANAAAHVQQLQPLQPSSIG